MTEALDALRAELELALAVQDTDLFARQTHPPHSERASGLLIQDRIRAEIATVGACVALAERLRAGAMFDLFAWCERGRAAGLTVSEMGDLSGVSRQTLHARFARAA